MSRRPLVLLAPSLLFAAEELPPPTSTARPDVVVVADRRPTELDRSTATVESVGAEDLHQQGWKLNPWEWIARLPGVYASSASGGIDGGLPLLRVRGANSYDTQILVDGVPVEDPGDPQGRANLATLNPAGLARAELVKGPQSGLYGSRSAGGVLAFETLRPTREMQTEMRVEQGSWATTSADLKLSGPVQLDGVADSQLGFALGVSLLRSRGFSSRTDGDDGRPDGHEDDGVQRQGVNGRLEWTPRAWLTLYLRGDGLGLNQAFDVWGDPDDGQSENRSTIWGAGTGAEIQLPADGALNLDLSYRRNNRDYIQAATFFGPWSDTRYEGDDQYLSLRWRQPLPEGFELGLGADGRKQALVVTEDDGDVPISERDFLGGGYLRLHHGSRWSEFDASLRRDLHSRAGAASSWRLGGALLLLGETVRPHASIGTHFRAPSLYETFDPWYGNLELENQRGRGWDAGLTVHPLPILRADVTYFRTDYDSLIDYFDADGEGGPALGGYANIDGYSVHGFEAGAELKPEGQPCFARAAYTWQHAREAAAQGFDNHATYLPKHRASLLGGIQTQRFWGSVGVERTASFETYGGATLLPWATVVGVAAGWTPSQRWELYARIDNALDDAHQANDGYAAAPRAYSAGVTGRF